MHRQNSNAEADSCENSEKFEELLVTGSRTKADAGSEAGLSPRLISNSTSSGFSSFVSLLSV